MFRILVANAIIVRVVNINARLNHRICTSLPVTPPITDVSICFMVEYQKKKPINQGKKSKNCSVDTYQPRQIIEKSQYKDEYRDKIKETVQAKK